MTRRINFTQGSDIISDSRAVATLVEDPPTLSCGAYGEKCGTSASTEQFKPAGRSIKDRLPEDNVLYNRKRVVKLLKLCCAQIDTTLSMSAL